VGRKREISVVSEKVGGVMCASSPCDLLRNERQVSYLKNCSGGGSGPHSSGQDLMADQVFTIIQQAKIEDQAGKFVRDSLNQHSFSHVTGSLMTLFVFVPLLETSQF